MPNNSVLYISIVYTTSMNVDGRGSSVLAHTFDLIPRNDFVGKVVWDETKISPGRPRGRKNSFRAGGANK